jgi:hypothetical protein
VEPPRPRSTRYVIDADDRIRSVDAGWTDFARENAAPELSGPGVIGRPLFDSIADAGTREIYRSLLQRVREQDTPVLLPFRCDAPDRRRYMRLVITPLYAGQVQFDAVLEREEPRPPVGLLDVAASRADSFVRACGWCKRIDAGRDDWVEAEDAVVRLDLFGAAAFPQITHGICPHCERSLFEEPPTTGDAP